jgi:hypothetical protein
MWWDDDSCLLPGTRPEPWLREAEGRMAHADALGALYYMLGGLTANQAAWVRSRPWYGGREVRAGHKALFPTGGWWCARTAVLQEYGWPDPAIRHRGGDVMFGELCRQQGLRLAKFAPTPTPTSGRARAPVAGTTSRRSGRTTAAPRDPHQRRKSERTMNETTQEHIKRLRTEAAKTTSDADLLEALAKQFPDLKVRQNRWKREHLSSALVNAQATEYESCHSCGCCDDSPLLIKAYITVGDRRIYGDPFEICVGEKRGYSYGDDLYWDWRERLEKAGFSQVLIEKVGRQFNREDQLTDATSERRHR